MWNNIGPKVQRLAKVLCWLGIILSFAAGIIMILSNASEITAVVSGIFTIVLGSLFSWVGAWVTYAVGEAAEYAEHQKLN